MNTYLSVPSKDGKQKLTGLLGSCNTHKCVHSAYTQTAQSKGLPIKIKHNYHHNFNYHC